MGINRVNLVGRLGREPEFRYIDKNTAIARLRLAVSEGYDVNGNKGKNTTWVNVVLWNRLAFVGKNGLCKGTAIAVEGKVSNHSYVDKDGVKHYLLEVDAESVECISKPKSIADKADEENEGAEESVLVDDETGEVLSGENAVAEAQDGEEEKTLSLKDVEDPKKTRDKKKKQS